MPPTTAAAKAAVSVNPVKLPGTAPFGGTASRTPVMPPSRPASPHVIIDTRSTEMPTTRAAVES